MTVSSKDIGTGGFPVVAVGCAVVDQDKILLVKHVPQKTGFWSGKWICPGGRLQFGETLKQATKREVLEETELEIEIKEDPIIFDRIVKDDRGETSLHVVYVDFLATPKGKALVHPGSDVGEVYWFPYGEIPWEELHEDTVLLLERILGLSPNSNTSASRE